MAQPLTLESGITLALGSSVLASVFTHFLATLTDRRVTKREVAYLAVRIATKLESHAEDLTTFVGAISDNAAGRGPGASTDLPILNELPGEQERWRDLDVNLTAEVLGVDQNRKSKQSMIDDFSQQDPYGVAELAGNVGTVLAMEAVMLAVKLRRRYKLPAFDPDAYWPTWLAERFDELPEHMKISKVVSQDRWNPWWKGLPTDR
jgi:hypothetical protein